MKVLILHRVDYAKIDYHTGIDHELHDVVYVGTEKKLSGIPAGLRCQQLVRADLGERVYESVLAAIEDHSQAFDRIISLSEYELLDAARLRDHLHVPGPSYEDARLVRDKVAMKHAVAAAGIDAPRFVPLASLHGAPIKMPWTGRTVLKPTHGSGSEDVVIFATAGACAQAIQSRSTGVQALDREEPALGAYEVEEYIEGNIAHFDGLVREGRVMAVIASRCIGTCERYINNHPVGTYQIEADPAHAEWVQRVISAVRLQNGAFHLEAFEAARGLVFLEIGNRVGGGGVSQATSLAWGADFQRLELELLIGDGGSELSALQQRGQYYGYYLFPGHCYADGQWFAPGGIDHFRTDPRAVHWYERETADRFDATPDYSFQALPFAGIVGAERPDLARQYIVDLFAALSWRPRAR
jgi:hypothetical protein